MLNGAGLITPVNVFHGRKSGRPIRVRYWVGILVLQGQVDVMVLALAADTQSSSLNTWEDDTDKLTKRCWVQRHDTLGATSIRIL